MSHLGERQPSEIGGEDEDRLRLIKLLEDERDEFAGGEHEPGRGYVRSRIQNCFTEVHGADWEKKFPFLVEKRINEFMGGDNRDWRGCFDAIIEDLQPKKEGTSHDSGSHRATA